jgi:hypothetical protein
VIAVVAEKMYIIDTSGRWAMGKIMMRGGKDEKPKTRVVDSLRFAEGRKDDMNLPFD